MKLEDLKETEMVTSSGEVIELSYPYQNLDRIHLDDIAEHLSLITRWNGARGNLNVAGHSLRVAEKMKERFDTPYFQLRALLHDAHEAYIGDIVRPVKEAVHVFACEDSFDLGWGAQKLKEFDEKWQDVVLKAFGLSDDILPDKEAKKLVAELDQEVLKDEFENNVSRVNATRNTDKFNFKKEAKYLIKKLEG